MEDFWENALMFLMVLLKVAAGLIAFRVVIFFLGYQVYIPLLDDLFWGLYDLLRPLGPW